MPQDQVQKTQNAVETARANLAAAEQRRTDVLTEIEAIAAERASLPFDEKRICDHLSNERAATVKLEIADRLIDAAKTALASAEAHARAADWQSKEDAVKAWSEELSKTISNDFSKAASALIKILARIRDFSEAYSAHMRETQKQGRTSQSTVRSLLDITAFRDFDKIYIAGPNGELLWPAESPARRAAREAMQAVARDEAQRAESARLAARAKADADHAAAGRWVP